MKVHQIGQFYGERKGWRMFDSHALTPEIQAYLSAESNFLERTMSGAYRTVIEVGCGYGRYLDWACSRGYQYIGLDIVPWLTELGQIRVRQARSKYPEAKCEIINQAAERLDEALKGQASEFRSRDALVFFPFNCLGNVSQFDTVLDAVKACQIDMLIATFKTDASSTKIRKDYYRNCGYEQLNSRIMKQGLLIVSEEGFHALAYHQEFLLNALEKRGFTLKDQDTTSVVGNILLFGFNKSSNSSSKFSIDSASELGSSGIEASICLLENDPLLPAADIGNQNSNGDLLSFRESTVVCNVLSAERIQCKGNIEVKKGTPVRLALPVIPPGQNNQTGEFWYADLVGIVESILGESDKPSSQFTVLLNKAEPAILERLKSGNS